jgi:hypothetical protein
LGRDNFVEEASTRRVVKATVRMRASSGSIRFTAKTVKEDVVGRKLPSTTAKIIPKATRAVPKYQRKRVLIVAERKPGAQ